MERLYGIGGVLLFVIGLVLAYLDLTALKYSYIAICLGLFFVFDAIEYIQQGSSMLQNRRTITHAGEAILLSAVFVGFVIEFYGLLTQLWGSLYYPQLLENTLPVIIPLYYLDMAFAYGFLILPAASMYRVIRYEVQELVPTETAHHEVRTYQGWLLRIGILCLAVPLIAFTGSFGVLIRFSLFAMALIGIWLIIEYMELQVHDRSLIVDVLDRRFDRLIALVLVSVVLGFVLELINEWNMAWLYSHEIPLIEYRLFSVPIIIVIGWIPLIAIMLSFYHIFYQREEPLF